MNTALRVRLSLCLVLGLAACSRSAPESRAPLRKLRVTSSAHLSWGPLLLANEAGYFRQEGLEIEWVHLPRGQEALVALLSGDVDVVPAPLQPALFSAIARGGSARMVAGMNYLPKDGCTYAGVVLRPGLTAARATRRIQRLDVSPEGGSRYLTNRSLATQGIGVDTLETVKLPTVVVVHSLETGAIDAAALTEPTLTRAASSGTLWLRAQDATPDFQWAAISFGDRLLHKDRETGVRFLTAFRRGIALFNAGKTPQNLDMLEKAIQEDRAILEHSCWPAFRSDGRINLASVLAYQQWAKEQHFLDQTASVAQLWDSSFVVASDTAVVHRRALLPKE